MAFVTPDYQAIRDAILRDIANQPRADGEEANVAADGDYAIRANATGAAVEGLYQHQAWIVRQLFPDSSDLDYLLAHAARRGLTRKKATVASGLIGFSGAPASAVPMGTVAKTSSGVSFVTTADGVLDAGGVAQVAAQAVVSGIAGNQAADVVLTLTAAPDGVSSAASIVSMTGGTDIESPADLLARLLFDLRNPPCGGAAHDYFKWATAVDGVTRAYVYPLRRGLGTVDVAILTAGGIPDAGLVATAQAYVDEQRPVQGGSLVLAPTAVPVVHGGTLVLAEGYALADVAAALDQTIAAYYAAMAPGDTVYRNYIVGIVAKTPGVIDFVLDTPAANVTTLVDATHLELATMAASAWA